MGVPKDDEVGGWETLRETCKPPDLRSAVVDDRKAKTLDLVLDRGRQLCAHIVVVSVSDDCKKRWAEATEHLKGGAVGEVT